MRVEKPYGYFVLICLLLTYGGYGETSPLKGTSVKL